MSVKSRLRAPLCLALAFAAPLSAHADRGSDFRPPVQDVHACDRWDLTIDAHGKTRKQDLLDLLKVAEFPGFSIRGAVTFFEAKGLRVELRFDPNSLNWPPEQKTELRASVIRMLQSFEDSSLACVATFGGER